MIYDLDEKDLEIIKLEYTVKRLKAAFRINMRKYAPDISHAEIDALFTRIAHDAEHGTE